MTGDRVPGVRPIAVARGRTDAGNLLAWRPKPVGMEGPRPRPSRARRPAGTYRYYQLAVVAVGLREQPENTVVFISRPRAGFGRCGRNMGMVEYERQTD